MTTKVCLLHDAVPCVACQDAALVVALEPVVEVTRNTTRRLQSLADALAANDGPVSTYSALAFLPEGR